MKKEKALNVVAGMCSKKEHCTQEIREKLVKWELPEEEIAQIMDFLLKHKFIDDTRYAQAYAEDKFRFNGWGKQKITLMLHRKKIGSEIISQALENLNTDIYRETCLSLLRQKMKSLKEPDPYKQKARLIRFGLSRGFDYDLLNRCIDELSGGNG